MSSTRYFTLEPLESRIAPANVFPNPVYPLPDVVAGPGQTGLSVDLSHIFDTESDAPYRTILKISTNFDVDPITPGIQGGDIYIELFDDLAPLTVQNFLAYAFNKNTKGDYLDTFFHRLEQGFVLQGGGYQTNGKKLSHIDTLPTVHNEFDPLRSNVRGTIAMAKVGGDPNSATSEWFVNLADNSSNLDNQNGGFTVFGRVLDMPDMVDGMEVIDAIAQLPTYAVFSGAKAPVQGFDPASGKTPGKDNLIRIEGLEIVPRSAGDDAGLGYQVESVKRVVNGQVTDIDSDILRYEVSGSTLNITYLDGKAGVAEVRVKISKGGEEYYETFRVDLQPNLTTQITQDNFHAALIPGDSAKVKLQVANTGGGLASGSVELKFYLIPLQEGRERVDLNSVYTTINVKSGDIANLTAMVQIPTDLSVVGEAYYQLGVEVIPLDDFNSEDRFTDDNEGKGNNHQAHNRFGSFATSELVRTKAVLTYVEPDGDVVQLSIKGVGTGKLVPGEDGILDLEISGTNAASKVIAKIISAEGDGNLSLRNIDAISVLGSLQFGNVDVDGNLAFTAGVKNLMLDEVSGPSYLSIGLFTGKESQKTKLTFGSVSDLSVQTLMSIQSITAREWLNTDGIADTILTPNLSSLKITGDRNGTRGDFEARLDVTGGGTVKTFKVAGLVSDSVIRIGGNVKTAAIGGMVDSSFLVGANSRPSALSDFTDLRTVKSFTITGVSGVGEAFVNSTVAADTFRKISIRQVDADSGTEAFGVVANTIANYSRDGGSKLKNLKEPGGFDKVGNYEVVVL